MEKLGKRKNGKISKDERYRMACEKGREGGRKTKQKKHIRETSNKENGSKVTKR